MIIQTYRQKKKSYQDKNLYLRSKSKILIKSFYILQNYSIKIIDLDLKYKFLSFDMFGCTVSCIFEKIPSYFQKKILKSSSQLFKKKKS